VPPVESEPASAAAVASRADVVLAALPDDRAVDRAGRPIRSAISRLPVPVLGAVVLPNPGWVQKS